MAVIITIFAAMRSNSQIILKDLPSHSCDDEMKCDLCIAWKAIDLVTYEMSNAVRMRTAVYSGKMIAKVERLIFLFGRLQRLITKKACLSMVFEFRMFK